MLRLLDRLEEVIITILIGLATVIIFVAVVHRYSLSGIVGIFNFARTNEITWLAEPAKQTFLALREVNLVWAQEVCIYLFVWMAKFGAAYGVRTGIHVGVDVLINMLDEKKRNAFIMFGLLAGALFTGIVAILGTNFVYHMSHTTAMAVDVEVKMWIIYLAIPLGTSLMCFRFLQVAWNFWHTGELPHHDHSHVDGMDDAEPAKGA
ncbi:MAG TPA: TRAP transporter small permease [Rhabdaerophilum sp.]|nr:TRAP transporter small permease [Rhabdaerophilum sp.]